MARNLVFALVAVALALLVLEGALRLVGDPPEPDADAPDMDVPTLPGYMMEDAALGWRGAPHERWINTVYVQWARSKGKKVPEDDGLLTNSLGLRDTELATPRPPHQVRVWAMGDSSVAGSGCPSAETYAQRLERTLSDPWTEDAATREVEVINAGIPGYTTFQSLFQLEENLSLGLDVVMVYSMNSDRMSTRGTSDAVYFNGWRHVIARDPLGFLATYRWLRWGLQHGPAEGRPRELRVPLGAYQANLNRVVELGKERGFSVLFIIPPTPMDLLQPMDPDLYTITDAASEGRVAQDVAFAEKAGWSSQVPERFRQVMSLVGHRAGVPVIDGPAAVIAAWKARDYDDPADLFVDEIHPSGEGHRVLAEAILPELRPLVDAAKARRAD